VKLGKTLQPMKVSIKRDRNMERVCTFGQTGAFIVAPG
jgi:hypothetical protein